jgi:hypothetical protein
VIADALLVWGMLHSTAAACCLQASTPTAPEQHSARPALLAPLATSQEVRCWGNDVCKFEIALIHALTCA